MTTLMKLKEAGKIRAIGVSNINVEQLEAYEQVGKLDAAQEQYSMIDRDLEADVLPYTRAHNIAMMAYSPLGLGLLTGKIGPERTFEGDDQRIDNPRFTIENRQRVAAMLAAFQPVADKHDLTMAQLVIAWTAAQPGITHVLVGARNTRQALENARAGSVALDDSDLQTMNQVIAQHAAAVV